MVENSWNCNNIYLKGDLKYTLSHIALHKFASINTCIVSSRQLQYHNMEFVLISKMKVKFQMSLFYKSYQLNNRLSKSAAS